MGRFLEVLFFSTWWIIAIFVLSFCLFERGSSSVNHDLTQLNKHIEELKQEGAAAREIYSRLHERLASFEDPAWIELLLIKNLGLVPKGYHKYILIEGEP